MSVLKIESFSGLSGDMFLSALTALCNGYDEIKTLPAKLNLENEAEVRIGEMNKKGIVCSHIKIIDKNRKHVHGHHAHHAHHAHDHYSHRHLPEINNIIDSSDLTPGTKKTAKHIFRHLGDAESKVHGVPIEKIHFHEVGAIDSILDIVGAALCIDKLKITKTYCTTITTGSGFVNTDHGKLPVPTPATKYLLEGFPVKSGDIEAEMVTPTGAAILRYLNPDFEIPVLADIKTAYGPGEKEFDIPNTLRISLCRETTSGKKVTVLQTNIDDMSGEYLGVEFQEKLFGLGAVEFYYEQVIMKRGRPGLVLTVLTKNENKNKIADYIFNNTTSIGIRYFEVDRFELDREIREIDTSYGNIKIKETMIPGIGKRFKPESQDIIKIAEKENKSSIDVLNQIIKSNENS